MTRKDADCLKAGLREAASSPLLAGELILLNTIGTLLEQGLYLEWENLALSCRLEALERRDA
jgi:hypothetical protein